MFFVIKREYLAMIGLVALIVSTVCVFGMSGNNEMNNGLNVAGGMGAAGYGNGNSVSVVQVADADPKTVIIDAGHGGDDPGAVSDYNRIIEKDITLEIAKRVAELLTNEGYTVIMTRTEDVLQYPEGTSGITAKRKADLTKRKQTIDSSNAICAVSIHLNKFKQTQYHGAQVFFPHNSEDSKKLAVSIQNTIKEMVDPENERTALVRGKPTELPIMIFKDLVKPTVVVECGFLSNQEEEKKLTDPAYKEQLAQSIKQGTINYLSTAQ